MTTGEKLIAFRLLRGDSQEDLCKTFSKRFPDTPIERGAYSMWESDNRNMPLLTFKNMVRFHRTTADELLFDDQIPGILNKGNRSRLKKLVT